MPSPVSPAPAPSPAPPAPAPLQRPSDTHRAAPLLPATSAVRARHLAASARYAAADEAHAGGVLVAWARRCRDALLLQPGCFHSGASPPRALPALLRDRGVADDEWPSILVRFGNRFLLPP